VTDEAMTEQQVNLFMMVKDKLAARIKSPCPVEIQVAVFTAVHNWQMNAAIDRQQTARYEKKQQSDNEPPTAAQLRYAEDLYIEIPANCTKKQLSKLINERAH
jgi:hypothetical protein